MICLKRNPQTFHMCHETDSANSTEAAEHEVSDPWSPPSGRRNPMHLKPTCLCREFQVSLDYRDLKQGPQVKQTQTHMPLHTQAPSHTWKSEAALGYIGTWSKRTKAYTYYQPEDPMYASSTDKKEQRTTQQAPGQTGIQRGVLFQSHIALSF